MSLLLSALIDTGAASGGSSAPDTRTYKKWQDFYGGGHASHPSEIIMRLKLHNLRDLLKVLLQTEGLAVRVWHGQSLVESQNTCNLPRRREVVVAEGELIIMGLPVVVVVLLQQQNIQLPLVKH